MVVSRCYGWSYTCHHWSAEVWVFTNVELVSADYKASFLNEIFQYWFIPIHTYLWSAGIEPKEKNRKKKKEKERNEKNEKKEKEKKSNKKKKKEKKKMKRKKEITWAISVDQYSVFFMF